MKPRIITISGSAGAGKTTVLELVGSALTARGEKVMRVSGFASGAGLRDRLQSAAASAVLIDGPSDDMAKALPEIAADHPGVMFVVTQDGAPSLEGCHG